MQCPRCGSTCYISHSKYIHKQSGELVNLYLCKFCTKIFRDKVRKFRYADKERFLEMYLNNVGIRKSAKLLGFSPSLLVRWVKELAANLRRDLSKVQAGLASNSLLEVIELDEICTRVKKGTTSSGIGFLFSATRQSCCTYDRF